MVENADWSGRDGDLDLRSAKPSSWGDLREGCGEELGTAASSPRSPRQTIQVSDI